MLASRIQYILVYSKYDEDMARTNIGYYNIGYF